MKVLITGGAGFLGSRLAKELLRRGTLDGRRIESLVVADLFPPSEELGSDTRVSALTGDLLEQCAGLAGAGYDAIFHLAAATSAECEADFDLGMRSNVDTMRALLEAVRRSGRACKLVFASSVAVFGSEPAVPMPATISDNTLPVPQSSYGSQKFICEQMVSEYTRKGYVDGRTARLMTVSVRPGRPNGAASSFLSGIIREPLHGERSVCPVPPETAVALASPTRAIEGLIAVAEATRAQLGGRTAINLPALTVRVSEMLDVLQAVGGREARELVSYERNETVERIVGGWPSSIDTPRARALGLTPDRDYREIVQQFVAEDERARTRLSVAAGSGL
ncbi:MAG TPA: D-erythronate dehydrogenase [Acidobacteriaceae bacterium]|jgi:nucleoside-diphosphate-sugar epimerase|nr:D-erythronate dehydrogenase [Acidobacteriaceae bacterium]